MFISFNSSSLSININQKDHFFPSDFFEPIYSPTNSNHIKSINYNNQGNKTKSTYVNLQKEEEEDKELLDLLDGKRKYIILIYIRYNYISIYKSK